MPILNSYYVGKRHLVTVHPRFCHIVHNSYLPLSECRQCCSYYLQCGSFITLSEILITCSLESWTQNPIFPEILILTSLENVAKLNEKFVDKTASGAVFEDPFFAVLLTFFGVLEKSFTKLLFFSKSRFSEEFSITFRDSFAKTSLLFVLPAVMFRFKLLHRRKQPLCLWLLRSFFADPCTTCIFPRCCSYIWALLQNFVQCAFALLEKNLSTCPILQRASSFQIKRIN